MHILCINSDVIKIFFWEGVDFGLYFENIHLIYFVLIERNINTIKRNFSFKSCCIVIFVTGRGPTFVFHFYTISIKKH